MKIIINNGLATIIFNSGKEWSGKVTPELLEELKNPDERILEEKYFPKTLHERVRNSSILVLRGNSVYLKNVSEISIPEDLVEKMIVAEENKDSLTIQKYTNFWKLVSLNPDERVRNNMFWFIKKWDMKISQSGLIIAYRNVDILDDGKCPTSMLQSIIKAYYETKYLKGENPSNVESPYEPFTFNSLQECYDALINNALDATPVYTDVHSHTFRIKLGQPVSMPRSECDADQEHSCSKGLHVGARGWLEQNYYGEQGLLVLVNPSNVVAVPTIDDYGKMRCCEYLPCALINYDDEGHPIEPEYTLYDDIKYLKEVQYEGNVNNKDIDKYTLTYHNSISRDEIYNQILKSLESEPEDEDYEEDDYDEDE